MRDALLTLANSLGFALCRVTRAAPPAHAAEYRAWLEAGHHAEMAWMGRDPVRRTDLEQVLPGVKSVIILVTNYFQGENDRQTAGRFARYAWGEDYHDVITARLREISAFLGQHGGSQRCYVDTGPILERDYAAAAGAGWHGKSTMLIHEGLGTWTFLSEILTTLEIEPDPPARDRCGRCTRCIDACPTGAITAPHQLDARRCVSYLTIENKGPIPVEFRRLIGDRVYGCDDCLDACPWNRFAQEARESVFALRPALKSTLLREFLTWDEERFQTEFKGSPIKRIKLARFLRNVCVALGNVGTEADLATLRSLARHENPLIAEHAAWAISEIETKMAASERELGPEAH